MTEQIGVSLPLLQVVSEERKRLGLKSQGELFQLSGSLDPKIRQKAQIELHHKWDLEPGRDANHAETINLMDIMDRYSPSQRRSLILNLSSLQLTQGCNGECPYCLFGIKKGVTSKFSYNSIREFFEEFYYKDPIPQVVRKNSFPTLYYDSDPFDWRDGDKDFSDIYKLTKKYTQGPQGLSTSVSKGSEESIVKFVKILADEYKTYKEEPFSEYYRNARYPSQMRFSVSRYNVQRVEALLERLKNELRSEKGMDEDEMADFFNMSLKQVHLLTDHKPMKLGSLIKLKDKMGELSSPACVDGVVISPHGVDGIMMVIPSVYDPSGERTIPLTPDDLSKYMPAFIKREDYDSFYLNAEMVQSRMSLKKIKLLPDVIMAEDQNRYLRVPGEPGDNIVFRLSRNTLRYHYLMNCLSKLDEQIVLENSSPEQRYFYIEKLLRAISDHFKSDEQIINSLHQTIVAGKEFVPQGAIIGLEGSQKPFMVSQEMADKINYYVSLLDLRLQMVKFIAGQASMRGASSESFAPKAAQKLQSLREEDIPHLETIFSDLAYPLYYVPDS